MAATKTSSPGRQKIRVREGEILKAYRDSVGVLTIGVGHTGRMSPPVVYAGMTITNEQSDTFLAADLSPVEKAINAALKVPVTANEFDGMASLWFNVGTGYVKTSSIIRCLNIGDVAGAAAGFDAYHKPAEIIGRRNGEKAQFLTLDVDTALVASARADVLTTKATTAKAIAVAVGGTAAATVVIGGASSIAAAASHPTAAIAASGAVGFAAIVQAVVAWWHTKRAGELTANAAAQQAVAS